MRGSLIRLTLAALMVSFAIIALSPLAHSNSALAGGLTTTYTAVRDAFVNQRAPTTNYGSSLTLKARSSPARNIYLRFNVQGLTGPIQRATLRVYARTDSALGYDVRALADNSWKEKTLTYQNAPAPSGGLLFSSGPFQRNMWVAVDVTPLIAGNGNWSFVLTGRDRTTLKLSSRESGDHAPQLVIEQMSADVTPTFTPTATATEAPSDTPTQKATPSPTLPLTSTPLSTATDTPTQTATPMNTSTPTQTTTATKVAPAVYWGAYVNGVPWNMSLQDAFEADAGKPVSIIHWGQPWIHNGDLQPFYAGDFDHVRQRGALPLLDWGSWDYSLGVNQPDFQLADIYNGAYDGYISQWATSAKAWGHPLFLRFDWEMNGWWQFPWSEQLNGNQPGDYVKAWRHVHDIFTQVGASNVTWVWCPNIISSQSTPLASLYPGDAYVDWAAMDGYNFGTDRGNSWQTFRQVFSPTYDQLLQLAPSKPIMIAETASSENGGAKAAWIADALSVQLPNNFPRIKALVWFNWNDNDPSLSWPIESSQASINAFAGGIANSYYATNNFANYESKPIPPLR
jgi:mannan endo-1,4-beta-mannosidase